MAPEPESDKEVEAILTDLDTILSGINPLGDLSASSQAPAKAAPSEGKLTLPPAAAPPAAAPPATPAPAAPPRPAAPQAREEAPAASSASAASGGIELAPRSGVAAPAPQKAPEKAVEKAGPPSAHAPLEIALPGAAAAAPPPAPAPAPVVAAPAPVPAPSAPQPAPAAVAAPPAAESGEDGAIPDGTPKDQIRRVAFLYASAQEQKMTDFMKFLDTVALKVSKRPMYIRRTLVAAVAGSEDPKSLLDRAREAGAAGIVAILAGVPDSWARELEEVASDADQFLRVVPPEEVQKRSTAVDLLVDLMLLTP